MKKSAILLAGLLLVSSLASAAVTNGNTRGSGFYIDDKPETLTFTVQAKVKEPLAAWWKDNGFFGSRTLTQRVRDLSIGETIPSIPTRDIYVIAPKSGSNQIHAEISVEPKMKLARQGGGLVVDIPLELKDKNGGAHGLSIDIDADSAGADGDAVAVAKKATGLDLGKYVGGEIIEVRTNTSGIRVPLQPGNYEGSAKIVVSLRQ